MTDFENSRTRLNLARAFAGECQDGAKYQFLAKMALDEGYYYLQMLLKTHAKNEMAHAKKFYDLMGEYGNNDTLGNVDLSGGYAYKRGNLIESIKATIDVENSQSNVVYPEFSRIAEEEGFPDIAKAFAFAGTVENCHKLLLEQVLEKLENGKLYKSPNAVKWK